MIRQPPSGPEARRLQEELNWIWGEAFRRDQRMRDLVNLKNKVELLPVTKDLSIEPVELHCLHPATPILTLDLRWVPVGELAVGDAILGFNEESIAGGEGKFSFRNFEPATITHTALATAQGYELTLETGEILRAT